MVTTMGMPAFTGFPVSISVSRALKFRLPQEVSPTQQPLSLAHVGSAQIQILKLFHDETNAKLSQVPNQLGQLVAGDLSKGLGDRHACHFLTLLHRCQSVWMSSRGKSSSSRC